MVAYRHCIVADEVHAAEVRLGVQQIGLRHAGVDVATGEHQHAAPFGSHRFTDAVYQRLLRRQTILPVVAAPEVAVVIVGMQNSNFIGFIFFVGLGRQTGQPPRGEKRQRNALL